MTTPDLFDTIARHYDLLYGQRDDDLATWLELAAHTEGPILEIGCGTGRVLLPLVQAGHGMTGVDISASALRQAQEKVDAAGLTEMVVLHQADMRHLHLPQQTFNLALVPINTFMHNLTLADQQACLAAIAAHLPPGGALVLDLYHPQPELLLEADGRLQLVEQKTDPQTGARTQWFSLRYLDLAAQQVEVTFLLDQTDPDGRLSRHQFTFPMRYLHRYEAELLLQQTGFVLQQVYGDYNFAPFEADSPRMILLAEFQGRS